MKITTALLLLGALHVSARSLSQTITLTAKEKPLKQIFETIYEQTQFGVIYKHQKIDLNQKVTVVAHDMPLEDFLAEVLTSRNLFYRIKEQTIFVRNAPANKNLDNVSLRRGVEQRTVEGNVTDEQGNPLQGATVSVVGTSLATLTDKDGNYQIAVSGTSNTLKFTIVGYEPIERIVGSESAVDIVMKASLSDLDEVVVVAYGKQRKLSVTGAVSSVGNNELRKSSSASLAVALAGRLPGLTSLQSGGGQPGRDDATMYLRGVATTNGQQPLILIDGVPRDNIRTLDPTEVESVTILKDASSTAVFGVRGANGVVLITTRRGQEGKVELNASLDQSWTSFTREPERLHSLEYMTLRNEAAKNDGILTPPFSQEVMDRYVNPLQGLDPTDPEYAQKARIREYMYPDNDYYRMFISRHTPQTRVNVNALGGTDRVSYFVNGALLRQGGNLNTEPESVLGYDPSSWMERYNFRANLDYKVSNTVKAFLNIGSYIEQVNMPATGVYDGDSGWMIRDLIYQAQSILPITPGPVTIDGFGVAPGQIVDPIYMDRSTFEIMNRRGYRREVRSDLNTSFGVDISLEKLTPGLSARGMLSYDSRATTTMEGRKQERLYSAEINAQTNEMTYAVRRLDESLLSLTKGADSRYNINLQGAIDYARIFGGNHEVGGMILAQRDYWESTGGDIPFNVIGVAGRLTYGYDNRYLAEFNMGYNGSEQFAPTNRFGFFPAASLGWVASNEKFMPDMPWLSSLKFRGSYGKVGNDRMGGTRFLYQSNITMKGGPLGSLGRGQGVNQGLLGNPNITWEVAVKQNYGIDLSLFNALDVVFDYFVEERSDILIERKSIPVFQGVPLGSIPRVNMGQVHNKGFELEVTYNKTIGEKVNLMFRGNYGQNENHVKFMDEPRRDETFAHRYRSTGYRLAQNWGYKIDYSNGNGMFNSPEELDNYLSTTTYGFGVPRVGDFKYLDVNGDGTIDDRDLTPIGYSSIPGLVYGFGLSVGYAGFEVSAFFQGVGKYSGAYSAPLGVYENTYQGTYFGYHKTAWTPERYAAGEEITYPALSTHSTTNHISNDYFIVNRSYLRLRNVEIAYTLPGQLLKRIDIGEIRAYVGGQNLFLWDNLPMGHLDPETIHPNAYPVTKMVNMGLNVTF